MKYKVDWSSPRQGIRSTTVDALGPMQAEEQVNSMYAHVEGFKSFCVSPVFEKEERYEPEESYSSSYESSGGGDDDFSVMIGGAALAAGGFIVLFGLLTLPTGIGAMIIGGVVGWVGWKVACWLSDRGW